MSADPTLRRATALDRPFIKAVYFETQRWIIDELFGWRGDEIEHAKFEQSYDEAQSWIVIVNGIDAGWIAVVRREKSIELEGIYLGANHQRQGLGTKLIRRVVDEAQAAGVPVTLSTATIHPARNLYRRLGFRETRQDRYKVYMERRPSC